MAKVTFIQHGMELDHEDIRTIPYNVGDPLPVALIEAAQDEWAKKMGHLPGAGHVAPGHTWDHVRVGVQSYSARQFQQAQQLSEVQALSKPSDKKLDSRAKIRSAPKDVPDWNLL